MNVHGSSASANSSDLRQQILAVLDSIVRKNTPNLNIFEVDTASDLSDLAFAVDIDSFGLFECVLALEDHFHCILDLEFPGGVWTSHTWGDLLAEIERCILTQ